MSRFDLWQTRVSLKKAKKGGRNVFWFFAKKRCQQTIQPVRLEQTVWLDRRVAGSDIGIGYTEAG